MTADHYAGAGRRWAEGAALVYAPIAGGLVARSPHPLAGRTVLDAGAGTGVATPALSRAGARVVAADLSVDMLAWNATARPPGVAADVRALPLRDAAVDDALAALVLNHLVDPVAGLAELRRVVRAGGAVLATAYGSSGRSVVRDRVDGVARGAGWEPPRWYRELKASVAPLVGSPAAMRRAAEQAGLIVVGVDERRAEVGVTEPEQLVAYRFGQARFAAWLDGLGPGEEDDVRRQAADAVRPLAEPYRPLVVTLVAVCPSRSTPRRTAHRTAASTGGGRVRADVAPSPV